MSQAKKRIVLKKLKSLDTLWHPKSRLVFKSIDDKRVVGIYVDGKLEKLNDECLRLCTEWNFNYDKSLVDEISDDDEVSETEEVSDSAEISETEEVSEKESDPDDVSDTENVSEKENKESKEVKPVLVSADDFFNRINNLGNEYKSLLSNNKLLQEVIKRLENENKSLKDKNISLNNKLESIKKMF